MAFDQNLATIADILSAKLLGDAERVVSGVATDSREVGQGFLFIARSGEQLDGHQYIEQAFAKGAAAAVVSSDWIAEQDENNFAGAFIVVERPNDTLGQLATWWREQLKAPLIAITGSNGKTTTKEILSSVLSTLLGAGTSNIKSYNNHVGLPQTLLEASRDDNWIVLEAGMSSAGELELLSAIAKPDVVVLLNVSETHAEQFSSLDAIADAKTELLVGLRDDGIVIYLDQPQLVEAIARREAKEGRTYKKLLFGNHSNCTFFASEPQSLGVDGWSFTLHLNAESATATLPLIGEHNLLNATAAAGAASVIAPQLAVAEIGTALASAQGAPMRLEQEKLGEVLLLNDCYNANPTATQSAISCAKDISSSSPFGLILGDMLELGEESAAKHREIGKFAALGGAALLISLGNFSSDMVDEAKRCGIEHAFVASDPQEALALFEEHDGAALGVVLVKASRGMRLERVVEGLRELLAK